MLSLYVYGNLIAIPSPQQISHFQSKVAEQVSATVPLDYTPSLNVVYFPQLGETFLAGLWPVWLIGFT